MSQQEEFIRLFLSLKPDEKKQQMQVLDFMILTETNSNKKQHLRDLLKTLMKIYQEAHGDIEVDE